MPLTIDLQDKIAVITGAGHGIGRASALEFAAAGATVVLGDINAETVAAVAAEVESAGGRAVAQPCDVTDAEQISALVATAKDTFGRLDVLFNHAGGSPVKPLQDFSSEDFHHVVALNLGSMFFGVQAALPVMLEQGGGTIVSTSSGGGLGAVRGLAVYGAAKAGMIALTRSIAAEYGGRGIRANVVSPGSMDTAGFRAWLDSLPGSDQDYFDQIPSGRLGQAEDIARVACFLASDYSSYINGVTIPVDGGTAGLLAIPRV